MCWSTCLQLKCSVLTRTFRSWSTAIYYLGFFKFNPQSAVTLRSAMSLKAMNELWSFDFIFFFFLISVVVLTGCVYKFVVKCSKLGASWRPCTMFLKKWTLSCLFLLSHHVSFQVLEWSLIGCHMFCEKCAISWQCHVVLSQLWRWLSNASGWWQLLKGASPCFVVCQ